MTMRPATEHVLVIPRALFDRLGAFQGLSFDIDRHLPAMLDPTNNYFLERNEAEHDPSRKQIIPYALFHHAGRFLRYVRSKGSGEQRLASKSSLGIGGHINTDDAEAASLERSTYMAGVDREIAEELSIEGAWTQRIVALLNDDTTEVGRVHLGVVHLVELESDRVRPNEESITELEFLTPAQLREGRDRLESWSQICLDGLDHLR
jgi:predicted NUDIX family phosphoesterase